MMSLLAVGAQQCHTSLGASRCPRPFLMTTASCRHSDVISSLCRALKPNFEHYIRVLGHCPAPSVRISFSSRARHTGTMTWLFGKKEPIAPPPPPAPAPETLAQQIKRNQRSIDKACRELERERLKMETQEQRLKVQIKKTAKEGQLDAARILARDLVRTRAHITRMYQMRTQLQSVSMQLTSMRTNESMASAMGNVVKIMSRINQTMNLPAMQNVMMQFEMEHGKMEMTQEMIDDAMGDVLSGADEEAQTDDVINQVLDELGLEQDSKLGAVASAHGAPSQMNAEGLGDSALEARMENLRR
eukprot:TRINITY_DN1006_c0_g1_i1.p2 TRINITY_DN1006_c0_g1~~TRINITY_DN1006_c0_g1_i1.p2  ORF type:complete len:302 (-),score=61.28 TRINITY_DN1006_c0_g1_i1:1651-2556(-)